MTGWLVLAGGLLLIAGVAAFGLALCWGAGRGDDLAALAETVGVVPPSDVDMVELLAHADYDVYRYGYRLPGEVRR